MRKPWTNHEEDKLKQMYASGMSYNEIGLALNRSYSSIKGRVALVTVIPRTPAERHRILQRATIRSYARRNGQIESVTS